MVLDQAVVAALTRRFKPSAYLRATRWEHRADPLGMGFGDTRFASPARGFKLLYIARALDTCIAETIIRDRFEGSHLRRLTRSEITGWGICEVTASKPLNLLDLRGNGCFELGISTDIAGGKAQDDARRLSEALYGTTLDGILYRSRLLKGQNCAAIYDRAVAAKLTGSDLVELETLAGLVPALRRMKIELI